MSDEPPGFQVHHKGIEIILGELLIVLINAPDSGFCVAGNLRRNLAQQLLCLFRAGPWHVVTHGDHPIFHTLIEHALTLDLTVLPVPPAVFGATHDAVVWLRNRLLECSLEVVVQNVDHRFSDQ
ncbi:hypothetical protein D3C86_1760550 [compost metagenome]